VDSTSTPPPEPHASPLPPRVEGYVGWFLDERLRDAGEEGRRARIVVVSSMAMALVSTFVLLVMDWRLSFQGPIPTPRSEVVTLLFSAVFGASTAYVVRRTGSARSAGWLLSLSMLVLILHFSLGTGGFWSPVLWWLCLLPMFSAFIGGPQVMAVASILSILLLWATHLADAFGALPTTDPDATIQARDDLLRSRMVLTGFAAFLGWYYEQLGTRAAIRLEAANRRLEASNDELRVSRLHLRQIAENIGQAVWMEEPGVGRLLYVNQGFVQLFGIGKDVLRDDRDAWKGVVVEDDRSQVPQGPDGEDHLYRVQTDKGEERWVRHACWRAEGSRRRVIHIAADATLKRHAENLRMRFLEAVLEVQENERRHLARELHDETGQALTALLVGLRALRTGLEVRKQAHIDVLAGQLRHVVSDLSRLARGLHPSVLDELGLSAGIERLASDLRAAHPIHVQVAVEGRELEDELTPQQRLTVYRIVQEALSARARPRSSAAAPS